MNEVVLSGAKGAADTTEALSVQGGHYWLKLHPTTRKIVFYYLCTSNTNDLLI